MRFAKDGEPFEIHLMREYGWLPWDIDRLDNRVFLELLAAERLAAERSNRRKG